MPPAKWISRIMSPLRGFVAERILKEEHAHKYPNPEGALFSIMNGKVV
jgi:hypothetical protein